MTIIGVTHIPESELPWRLKTDDGLHSAGRTLSGALSMLATMQKRREER